MKGDSGGAISRLKVPTASEPVVYITKEGVERESAAALKKRFRIAMHAPILQDKRLFNDFGYLGDTVATKQLLEGTYQFPPDMDDHTKLLLEEAHLIYQRMSDDEIRSFIACEDFQYFWQQANERIQSSESGCHFGHYKAASFDDSITALHCGKLSLAAESGVPLDRWGNGLTVLLEKVKGNIFINKMRAICLLEADYNWPNKLIYAKWMMDRAYDAGIVPAEQFARRGVQAAEGVLTTTLFSDIVRVMHRTAAIESVDLANCYDAVAHPIPSIALQSFKVRQTMVAMMLYVLQTMKFYLRTAYGQSEWSYGGSKEEPMMCLAQGN